LNLTKKDKAVAAVCVIAALLVDLMNGQLNNYLLYKEKASQQIRIGRFYEFTVLKAVVDQGLLGTEILFSAVCCDFDSNCY